MSDETACNLCGAFGDIPHGWVEGDCILPHRAHSRKLLNGTNVCHHCTERWTEWLQDITDLWCSLDTVIYVADVTDDTAEHTHSKRTGSPSPLRLTAWALWRNEVNDHIDNGDGTTRSAYLDGNLPDIAAVLTGWADTVYEATYKTTRTSNTATSAIAYLTANINDAAASPHADDIDAELRWVRNALQAAHGITDPQPLFACLEVQCAGNVWPMTAGSPACDRCGRRYGTLDQVRALGYALPERKHHRLTSHREGNGHA